ncbi:MAG: phage baseplate assembly protein V [bacterium]
MLGNRPDANRRRLDPIGWLCDTLARIGIEGFAKRYYGIYPGTVVNNADPDNRGRIQALCPAVGVRRPDQVGKGWWAWPCMPGLAVDPETKQVSGLFHPPDVGAAVWMQFQHGDPEFPVYMGGYLIAEKASDTFDAEGALRKGIRTRAGHFLRMSDDPEDLHIMLCKGDGAGAPSPVFLAMDKDGAVQIENQNGSTIFMSATKAETSIMTANDQQEVTSLLMLGDDKITLATKSGGAIGIDGKNITITGDNVVADCSQQFAANAGTVMLGKGASEPAVLGTKLMIWAITHGAAGHLIGTPTPGSPVAPGAQPPPTMGKELSTKVYVA